MGKNVRLKPISMVQKFHLPMRSLSIRPKILGHQK